MAQPSHFAPVPKSAADLLGEKKVGIWAAAEAVGLVKAFRFTSQASGLNEVLVIRELREQSAHTQLGLDWKEFCSQVLGRSHSWVHEALQNLDTFGEEFMRRAEELGIGRNLLRAMRGMPSTEIELLQSGVIVEGGREIPLDEHHLEEWQSAVQRKLNLLTNQVEDLSASAADRDAVISEKDQEIGQLREKLSEKRELEKKQKRHAEIKEAANAEIIQGLFMVANALAELAQRVEIERADPEEVRGVVHVMSPLLSRLTNYTRERERVVEENPDIDPVALDEVLRMMSEDEEADDEA